MASTSVAFRYRFWIIGVIFWLAFACYSLDRVNSGAAIGKWLSHLTALTDDTAIRLVFVIAAALVVAAAAIRTWATAYLHSNVVHDASLHADRLVADGPYRLVRNPLYLGTTLLSFGMGPMTSRLGFIVLVMGNLLFTYVLIRDEETQLSTSQGESYRRYLNRVPRLLPSFVPLVEPSGARPRWGQAFLGEGFFWGFALAGISFAITLKLKFWFVFTSLGFPFYFVSLAILKRKARTEELPE
jgi:protein-S-isoprenylcysteine O-methyltransferase Ste14